LEDDLRSEMATMAAEDQRLRRALHEMVHDPAATAVMWQQIHTVDRANTSRLKQITTDHGWPGRHLVGDGDAWLLVQHADRDPAFQHDCLELLDTAATCRDVDPMHLAYLTDRVATGEGRPQTYGTQLTVVDGRYVPLPVRDIDVVHARRAAVGLEPLDQYVSRFRSDGNR
jgi:hypothetical protein